LFELLYTVMTGQMKIKPGIARKTLNMDYERSGQKGRLELDGPKLKVISRTGVANKRQQKHLRTH
jgi:hypothetical protein